MILATAHLSRDEIFAVVDVALVEGVKRIVITHPEFPSQNISAVDQKALTERGAYLEHCLAPVLFGKHDWQLFFDNIRVTGYEIRQPPLPVDEAKVLQVVEIDYVLEDSQRLRKLSEQQEWRHDPESKQWQVFSPFPEFR